MRRVATLFILRLCCFRTLLVRATAATGGEQLPVSRWFLCAESHLCNGLSPSVGKLYGPPKSGLEKLKNLWLFFLLPLLFAFPCSRCLLPSEPLTFVPASSLQAATDYPKGHQHISYFHVAAAIPHHIKCCQNPRF